MKKISAFFVFVVVIILFSDNLMDSFERFYDRHIIRVINDEALKRETDICENKAFFDEAVYEFVSDHSSDFVRDTHFPAEINYRSYKRVKDNPYFCKWVLDNYRFYQNDITGIADQIKMLPHIKILSIEERSLKNKKLYNNFLQAFFYREKILKIPHVQHRIWITGNEKPSEVPDESIEHFIKSLKVFPNDWKHIFWCIDPNKIPNTIKKLKESKIPIEIRAIKDMNANMPGKCLFDKLYEMKHYAIAGDLAKRYIVYKLGGLYCDIGILWKKDPTEFVDIFDRISNLSGNMPDVAVFAFAAGSRVEETFFKILEEFPKLSNDIKDHFKGGKIMLLTWSTTLRTLLDAELSGEEKVFYWDQYERLYRRWTHYNTWGSKKGFFGNAPVITSDVSW